MAEMSRSRRLSRLWFSYRRTYQADLLILRIEKSGVCHRTIREYLMLQRINFPYYLIRFA